MSVETLPRRWVARRGYYGSLVQTGAIFGAVAGNGMFLLITAILAEPQFESWGWQVPFLTGPFLVVIGVYVQLKIEDTPVFQTMRNKSRADEVAASLRAEPFAGAGRRSCRPVVPSSWSTAPSTSSSAACSTTAPNTSGCRARRCCCA